MHGCTNVVRLITWQAKFCTAVLNIFSLIITVFPPIQTCVSDRMYRAQKQDTNESHALAQLVEALRYKSEGRGFDSRWFY